MTSCILPQDLQSSKVFFEHQRGNTSLDPGLSEYHHSCSAQGSWGNSKTLHQSSRRAKQIKLLTVKEGPCYPVSKGSVVYEWGAGALELMNWQWVLQHLHNCLKRPLQLGLPPLCLEPSRPKSQYCFSVATRWWACWWKLSQTWEARGKNFCSGSCRPLRAVQQWIQLSFLWSFPSQSSPTLRTRGPGSLCFTNIPAALSWVTHTSILFPISWMRETGLAPEHLFQAEAQCQSVDKWLRGACCWGHRGHIYSSWCHDPLAVSGDDELRTESDRPVGTQLLWDRGP